MSGHSAPKGLHRRTKALELRLAEMEASMAALQSEYAAASAPSHDTLDVSRLAERLAATQKAYDDVLLDLRELQSMALRLRDWGLSPADTASWTSVCRALALPMASGPHRAVRSGEPVLHVMLHRCALSPHCSLSGVTYTG